MPNRKTSPWYLAAAALLFVAFVLTVIDDGDAVLRAILDPASARAIDWKKVYWIFLIGGCSICFGLLGYLGLRKSSGGS